MSCLVGNSDCFKQSSILTLEKSQVLGGRIGKVSAGPWVRPFWDSDQLQPEKTMVPALLSSPCTVERPFTLLPAGFISSYAVILGAPPNSPISPGRETLLFYFAFNEMTRLVLEMQCAVCHLSGRNASGL